MHIWSVWLPAHNWEWLINLTLSRRPIENSNWAVNNETRYDCMNVMRSNSQFMLSELSYRELMHPAPNNSKLHPTPAPIKFQASAGNFDSLGQLMIYLGSCWNFLLFKKQKSWQNPSLCICLEFFSQSFSKGLRIKDSNGQFDHELREIFIYPITINVLIIFRNISWSLKNVAIRQENLDQRNIMKTVENIPLLLKY